MLLNALQASEPGGWVELTTEMEPGTLEQEPLVRLDVRDNGSGIAADLVPHIFDPFFTTKSEGTGLGLSVSYNIVAEHKGRLEVQSEPGKGTCFSMYLPILLTPRRSEVAERFHPPVYKDREMPYNGMSPLLALGS